MNLFWNDWNLEELIVDLPDVVGGRVGGWVDGRVDRRVVGLVGLLVVTFPPGRK